MMVSACCKEEIRQQSIPSSWIEPGSTIWFECKKCNQICESDSSLKLTGSDYA